MIVALDMQLSLGTATGIGEYARGLADALRTGGVTVTELAEPRLDPWRFDRRVIWDQVVLPRRARASGADLLHCASGTMPLRLPMPAVVTVHDVAWLRVQAHVRPYVRYYFGRLALAQYPRAAAIAVDSAFSKSELLQLLDVPANRVHVVYPGVAADFSALTRGGTRDRGILVPGTVERRKNLEVLIRALPTLPGARVISVGPFTPYRDHCMRLASELGVADRVELRGYVPRSELLALYERCAVVAVPSRYEGFGYAAAQALCSGAPLAIANASSLPEIAGAGVAAADPDRPEQWAGVLNAILDDPDSAEQSALARRAGATARFSWSASAAAMAAVYDGVPR